MKQNYPATKRVTKILHFFFSKEKSKEKEKTEEVDNQQNILKRLHKSSEKKC